MRWAGPISLETRIGFLVSSERLRGELSAERRLSVKQAFASIVILISAVHGALASGEIALKDTVYSLPEILIEAERLSDLDRLKSRPAFITIVPLDDADRRLSSAADYLAQTVGCHVRNTGGYGAYSTASLRGSSAKQVKVYLDGIPLNPSHSGIVDLADLPLSSIERIEVYRGFGPFDLSGSSIGGVVNLITKKPERAQGQIALSYGTLATKRLSGSYSLTRSDWNILAVAKVFSTEGDFEFLDDNGTPYNTDDDELTERVNNQVREYEALLKATGPLAGGTLAASNQFYYRKQGLPGYSTIQSETERMIKHYDLVHIGWRTKTAAAVPLHVEAGVHYLTQTYDFEDRRPKTGNAKPDEENITTTVGATLRWRLFASSWWHHRGHVSLAHERFRPRETFIETVEGESQRRLMLSVSIEDEIALLDDRIRFIPSGRYERYVDDVQPFEKVRSDMAVYFRGLTETEITNEETVGTVGIAASPGLGLTLKANYGRHFRIPSLMEIFGYRGMVIPNPNLEPEVGLNRDIGIRWDYGLSGDHHLAIEYVYFWSNVDKLIMFTYIPFAQAAQAINIDSAEINGYEVSLAGGSWHGFAIEANATYMRAINAGPVSYKHGKRLPNRPELEAFARIQWQKSALSAFYEFNYIAGNYWNEFNGVAPNNKGPLFPIRRIHNGGFTLPTGIPATGFTLEVRNITDARYEDVMGYPLPGRSVYGTIAVEI
jgi:iron complex outermembrane receptor protein